MGGGVSANIYKVLLNDPFLFFEETLLSLSHP